jgi:acetylornithine deacetylase/succinyl-diaminopimelate desuccinylase-like protein
MFPGDTPEGTRDALARVINDTTVQVISARDDRAKEPPTPLLPEVMEPISRITRDMFGDIPVIPTMSTGATDSRYFRQLGIPAFGVSGLFSDPSVDARAHGRDERMRVQSFYEGQEFLYRLTKALSQPPAVP